MAEWKKREETPLRSLTSTWQRSGRGRRGSLGSSPQGGGRNTWLPSTGPNAVCGSSRNGSKARARVSARHGRQRPRSFGTNISEGLLPPRPPNRQETARPAPIEASGTPSPRPREISRTIRLWTSGVRLGDLSKRRLAHGPCERSRCSRQRVRGWSYRNVLERSRRGEVSHQLARLSRAVDSVVPPAIPPFFLHERFQPLPVPHEE